MWRSSARLVGLLRRQDQSFELLFPAIIRVAQLLRILAQVLQKEDSQLWEVVVTRRDDHVLSNILL